MVYIWPVPNGTPINQLFGTNPGGFNPAGGHTGTDFGVPTGTPVRAIGDGTVTFADWSTTLPADYSRTDGTGPNPYWLAPAFGGIVVAIDHGAGQPVSIYAHLSSTDLNSGDTVTQGQIIGLSGSTGGASSGPHLHFETLPDGFNLLSSTYGRVNPATFCTAYWEDVQSQANNITPILNGNQRKVGQYGVNRRSEPKTTAPVIDNFPADTILDFKGFVHGELVNGTDIWFVGAYSGGYFTASAFDDAHWHDLTDLTPAPAAVIPVWRKTVGTAAVNYRKAPKTSAEIIKTFQPGEYFDTFLTYTHGESIDGNDIWYKGSQTGGYAWSGGFTDPSVSGMTEEKIVTGRTTGNAKVNFRVAPITSAANIDVLDANTNYSTFTVFTHGQSVNGNDVWFKGTQRGGYSWSGAFTDPSTTGMTEEITTVTPTPSAAPVAPIPDNYSFTPDFDFVEYIPANINNLQRGNFPDKPEMVVIHQFGTPGVDTLTSTLNTFQSPTLERQVSAHFVVSGKRIIQMVSLKDRAYHAYVVGNNYVGIETDPAQDADTIASVNKLLKALKDHYGYVLTPIKHKDVPQCVTSCGTLINLDNYQAAPDPVPTPVQPTPDPVPEPTPTPTQPIDEEAIIEAFLLWLKTEYFKSK